jgi:mannose-1-phosphate guanylyltransferase
MPRETFIVSNGDELKDIDIDEMFKAHKRSGALVTIALTTVNDPSAYGVARLSGNHILEFVEKPSREEAPSNLINAGFYLMEPEVLDMVPDGFSMLEKDVFPVLAKEGKLFGFPFSGQWFDTGDMERYEKALKEWNSIMK